MAHWARLRVPCLVAALAVLGATSCVEQEAPMDTFELSGRVTSLLDESGGGDGIPGAHVTFTSDTLLRAEATTDGDGRYRMRVSTDHPFGQVRAEAGGFQPNEATVYFDSPQRVVDVELRRAM